jgi:hypothetical protein
MPAPLRSTCNSARLRAPLLAAALVLLPAALASQAQRATVRGRVVEAATGNPVAGAFVAIPELRKRAYTDRTGTFTLTDVPVGPQRLEVSEIGFRGVQQPLTVPAGDTLTVRLEPDPVVLQGITAQVDRMEYRRVHSTMASSTFDEHRIAAFGHPNPVDFLRNAANLRIAPCNGNDLYGGAFAQGECVRSRGSMERVQVVLDEHVERGGIDMLNAIPLQEIYRMEVYEGGALILVYTKQFMQGILRTHRELHPLNAFRRMTESAAPGQQPISGTP